jgi:RNA polymerase sigma factor (sigma-70 family)
VQRSSEWEDVVAILREARDPRLHPAVLKLYKLAEETGVRVLHSWIQTYGAETVRDVVLETVVRTLDATIASDTPRAFFIRVVRNAMISYDRSPKSRVVESPAEQTADDVEFVPDPTEDHAFRIDARRAFARLPPRDQQILLAVAAGEDRTVVAQSFGTSRANVDQLLSRARKRFAEEDG